ncbi:MAG TPA: ABC transporter ATP-binding protein [Deltaproteobacteria bacterium]|nr:ABC transporter ATP-binding protein [Deltaproteobacteria bacterium]
MLLEINSLCTGFHTDRGYSQVLNNVDLTIADGQTVALVGESGSGKSVTALSILQLFERGATVMSGEILFQGENLLNCTENRMRQLRGNRIAMIFQEPMISMNPVYPIGDQLMEPIMLHQGLNKNQARAKAISLLRRAEISDPAGRLASFPHQLSGGQIQRVMIAMALACQPRLLIADEPTTALDVTIQAQILTLIKDIQQEQKMAMLLITHDLNMVRKIADQVHIMHQGKIVEAGPTDQVFTQPKNDYTIKLLSSVPHGTPPVKNNAPPLLDLKEVRCHFPIKSGFFKKTVGMIKAVDGVSFTIRQGTTFGVVGESGSGKTTLGMSILKLVAGTGAIVYQGKNLLATSDRNWRPLRRELQVVFQDPFSSLSPRLNVGQIIGEGLSAHGIGSKTERLEIVRAALLEVGLEPEMADRYPHEFSGGQRQRIAIARAIVLQPKFIVLDEPTSALDMTIQAQIIELLKKLQDKYGITYFFISHDLRVIKAMADEVAVMQNGEVVECGPAAQLFAAPEHPYTRKLFAAAFDLAGS